jgi:hypothetical protein
MRAIQGGNAAVNHLVAPLMPKISALVPKGMSKPNPPKVFKAVLTRFAFAQYTFVSKVLLAKPAARAGQRDS